MNEELNILSQKVEALLKETRQHINEIAALKAEIARLKGEDPSAERPTAPASRAISSVFNFEDFIGLKLIHFVGIIVLLIGLSIGVKYAIDANLISPLLRIILAYCASIILYVLSLRLQKKFLVFSVILFSGAMASAYFTSYAAFEYYSIFSRLIAFGLMLLLTIFTVFTALRFDRQEIAVLGLAGAYAIPFFVGSNSDNLLALFSYMLVINTGILFISFKKYWLYLTYISFLTSWTILISAMLMRSVQPHIFEFRLFAFIFFFLFLVNCLAFKFFKKEEVSTADIMVVIINSVLLYAVLCYLFGYSGFSEISSITLLFALAHFAGAMISKRIHTLKTHFSDTLLVLSFIAAVLFVVLKFEGFLVTIIWVLMAITVFAAGMFWKVKPVRMASIALFGITLVKLLVVDSDHFTDLQKIVGWIFTGAVLLIVSFLYQKFKQRIFTGADD